MTSRLADAGDRTDPSQERLLPGAIDQYLATRVPVCTPTDTAGQIRAALVGADHDTVDDIAVCDTRTPPHRLVGLIPIRRLLAADPDTTSRAADGRATHPSSSKAWTANRRPGRQSSTANPAWPSKTPTDTSAASFPPRSCSECSCKNTTRTSPDSAATSPPPKPRGSPPRNPSAAGCGTDSRGSSSGSPAPPSPPGSSGSSKDVSPPTSDWRSSSPASSTSPTPSGTQTEALIVRGLSVGAPVRTALRLEAVTGPALGLLLSLVSLPIIWARTRRPADRHHGRSRPARSVQRRHHRGRRPPDPHGPPRTRPGLRQRTPRHRGPRPPVAGHLLRRRHPVIG